MSMHLRDESNAKHSPREEAEIREILDELIAGYDTHLRAARSEKRVPFTKEDRERVATIMLRRAEKNGSLYTADEVSRVNKKGVFDENKRVVRELSAAYQERRKQKQLNKVPLEGRKIVATDSTGLVVDIGERPSTIAKHNLDAGGPHAAK